MYGVERAAVMTVSILVLVMQILKMKTIIRVS